MLVDPRTVLLIKAQASALIINPIYDAHDASGTDDAASGAVAHGYLSIAMMEESE